jgi:hypothetical protein
MTHEISDTMQHSLHEVDISKAGKIRRQGRDTSRDPALQEQPLE